MMNIHTVDGSEILHHLGCIKPCKNEINYISTGEFTGFLVAINRIFMKCHGFLESSDQIK